jgi:Zn-dependent protease
LYQQRFRLGTYFGIDLFVHWTFALLLAFVVYTAWVSGADRDGIIFAIVQLLAVFLCVTLHEYGHALAARQYGVGTYDITLLPIGGVARLSRIPRVPLQEFVIAIAGPAVNVVIAMLLFAFIFAIGQGWIFTTFISVLLGNASAEQLTALDVKLSEVISDPSPLALVLSLLLINMMLVAFNLIPAFPMDGGRVLRSLLAMVMPYLPATRLAQRIGMVCAVLMAAAALVSDPPKLVMALIAGFIAFAGLAEVRQVELRDAVSGLKVADVMSVNAPVVRADMPLDQLWRWWRNYTGQTAAVVGVNGIFLGLVRLQDLAKFFKGIAATGGLRPVPQGSVGATGPAPENGSEELPGEPATLSPAALSPAAPRQNPSWVLQGMAMDLVDHEAISFESQQSLEGMMGSGRKGQREYPVVDGHGRLVGWVDLDSVLQRAAIARVLPAVPRTQSPFPPSLDPSASLTEPTVGQKIGIGPEDD